MRSGILFFFFKQKTAYEMRISDWSSDVCSSDLAVKAGPTVPPDLIHTNLPLKAGDPIEADRIQGAEANVSLKLPQMGYPFVKLGTRDILLDRSEERRVGKECVRQW